MIETVERFKTTDGKIHENEVRRIKLEELYRLGKNFI